MTYTFAQVQEHIRMRVRNLSFEGCTGAVICYGVPLTPEREDRLSRAGERLAELVGFPDWLSGIAPIFDGSRAYLEVGVLPGKTSPPLPAAVDDFPVVTVQRDRAIPYGGT